MRSPIIALTWEIWRRNRALCRFVTGITLFAWFFVSVLPDSFWAGQKAAERMLVVDSLLMTGCLLLVFGIFNYTEFNPQKEWTGFPYRLFTLPVTTWRLVAWPMTLAVVVVELVYAAWVKLVFAHGEMTNPKWLALLLGSYMVFYQTTLWTLAGFRILRMVALGFIGTSCVAVAFLPLFGKLTGSPWLSEKVLSAALAGFSVAAFVTAWIVVGRQRCGGGHRCSRLKALLGRLVDALPRRRSRFRSPEAAQFWFEWRRTGLMLPFCVGAVLVVIVGPLSWNLRTEPLSAPWLLGWTLALPMLLAVPMGKGFSKPDFWSRNLALPPFMAVRPLATGELVVVKMKVAALSAALSWMLVIAFLALWLPLWADLTQLSMIRVVFWMVQGHSPYPQDFMAALFILAFMLITWRFLVGGLWIGLSGSKRLFVGSAVAHAVAAVAGIIGLMLLLDHGAEFRRWLHRDPDRLLALFEWVAALAVIAKFWLAARFWRYVSPKRIRRYLLAWLAGASGLVALATLLWADGTLSLALMAFADFWPLDSHRLGALLVLLALLVVPLARPGLAPAFLAKNRHG